MKKTIALVLALVACNSLAQQAPTVQQVADRAAALAVACDGERAGARNALIAYAGTLSDELAKAKADLAAAQEQIKKLTPKEDK